jgi:non-specific serine/threonine protein kinase
VWFADLTSAADAAGVIRAVAAALGVSDEPGRTLTESVVEQLCDCPALLVLDNCEQALDAVAEFVTRLLGAAPRVRVLATSREALGVPGENLVAVAPLGTPAVADTAVGSVAECDAVRLFLARASAVHATFSLSEQNASAVASVCRRLDGIPLAIELAAAQLDVLEPAQLDALLEDRFALLQSPGRGRQARHRTLETMLASSYDRLDAIERATMDRLAVFRGTFSLDAVHAVAIDDPVTPANVLDAVTALVRKSLVVAVETGGERRFRLLETMRHYAGQQLIAAGDLETRRDRHFRWVLDLASRAGEGLAGPAQVHWFDALDDDLDNIEAALEWSLGDPTRAADALEAVLGLYGYWVARGTHRFQGVRWSEATATAATNLEPATRTQALMNGSLLLLFNDLGAAADLADAAHVLAGDDERASAYATVAATFVASFRGEHIDMKPIARACDALSDDVSARVWAEGGLALATASQGAFQDAYQQLIAVAQRSRDLGDRHMYGAWLSFCADLGAAVGDSEGARSEAFEALDISREVGCTSCEAQALTGIALLGGRDELGGSVDSARRAVELAHGIREIFNVLAGLDVLAGALARQRRDDDAVTIAAATASLRTATGFASPFPGREGFAREGLALARSRMDGSAFDSLWRTGAALDYEHAVDYAIT